MNINQLREMRKQAKKEGKKLYATLDGKSSLILALTNCAPRYGCPAFRCMNGGGWYGLNAAQWTFTIQ